MFTRRLMLSLLLMLLFSGTMASAQTETNNQPPIIFITANEILKWTGTGDYIHVADILAPAYEITDGQSPYIWEDIVVSPDLHYVAYSAATPEWQEVINNNAMRDEERVATNIYIVDIATGETKPVILQTTAEARQQTRRWGLIWSTDSQTLIWLEDAEAGNLIGYDLATSTFTTIVDNAAPYYSQIRTVTDNRIVINDLSAATGHNDYSVYALDGTLISQLGALESTETFAFAYQYIYGDDVYLGTNVERVNLTTGERSPIPTGRLVFIAADAPDTSFRVTPAEMRDIGCFSDIVTPDGEFVRLLPATYAYDFSPDGRAIIFPVLYSNSFVIVSQSEDGTLIETRLPELGESPYVVQWGTPTFLLEPGDESFHAGVNCGFG